MRSIWKGSISFGLVNIPVAVYPATREQKIAFKQLRSSDLSPIRHQKVAAVDVEEREAARSFGEREIPSAPPINVVAMPGRRSTSEEETRSRATVREDEAANVEPPALEPVREIVKGYEYEKGKFIAISEEEFARVKIESTHTIEITDFVELSQIDTKFFHKPYFLEPGKGGEKGYALLHRGLAETGKIGIAKVAIRSREYLAAVKPDGLFLMLELMHFAQEVLEPESLKGASQEVTPRELEMAKHLIDAMTTEWDPQKYENSYQLALKQLVEEKLHNRPAAREELPTPKQMGMDIVAILQQSLAQATEKKKQPRQSGGRRTTSPLLKQKRPRNDSRLKAQNI